MGQDTLDFPSKHQCIVLSDNVCACVHAVYVCACTLIHAPTNLMNVHADEKHNFIAWSVPPCMGIHTHTYTQS